MKYIVALLIACSLSFPSVLAQNGATEASPGTAAETESIEINPIGQDMELIWPQDHMEREKYGLSKMHKGKYGYGFGWHHAGWMLFHFAAWLVFLAISTYVVRWTWDRAGRKK